MKVYTLTFHYNTNFGAIIQAYALAKYLNRQDGIECKVLNYHPKGWDRSLKTFPKPHGFRGLLKNLYMLTQFKQRRNLKKKKDLVLKFVADNIPVDTFFYDDNNIRHNPPIADAFVVGSDQVWNFKFSLNLTYFLDFVKGESVKRVSYAASIADDWTEDKAQIVKPYLVKFDGISIREEGNLPMLKGLVPNNHPTVVCDPVFLLSRNEWLEIASKEHCINEPYILCYFLGTNEMDVKTVSRIKKILGIKIVYLKQTALDKFNSDIIVDVAGPSDFIGLIANATFVITNSFHASAFSVIFRRNFCYVPRRMANERVISLKKMFCTSELLMTEDRLSNLTLDDLTVDYSKTDEAMKDFTDYSKRFLLEALYGKKVD